ncbi:hypothetical protein EMIT0P395_20295 [Pseudomonas sp. IT-P395]
MRWVSGGTGYFLNCHFSLGGPTMRFPRIRSTIGSGLIVTNCMIFCLSTTIRKRKVTTEIPEYNSWAALSKTIMSPNITTLLSQLGPISSRYLPSFKNNWTPIVVIEPVFYRHSGLFIHDTAYRTNILCRVSYRLKTINIISYRTYS